MFKRKLFKHAFSKRALPVILSVAMIFQSMPATAMAAENAVAVEGSVEDTTDEQTATEAAEPASEQGDSEAEPSEAEPAEDSETPVSAEESKEDSETPASAEEPTEDSKTPASIEESKEDSETPASTEESKEDNESTVSTEEPSQDATVSETTEVAEESTTTEEEMQEAGETDQAIINTKIEIVGLNLDGFEKQNDKTELTYNISYKESNNSFNNVISEVPKAVKIYVNDENRTDALKPYLAFDWKKTGTEEVIQGLPKEVGSYTLHLSLDPIDGVCGKAEFDIYFNIEKAELKFKLQNPVNEEVKTGSKISEFKTAITENYRLVTLEGNDYNKALYDLKPEDIVVYEVGDDGTPKATEDVYFNSEKKYKFTVQVALDTSAAANYEVDCNSETEKKYYPIEFAGLTETKVLVTLNNPGTEIRKDFDEKELTVEEAAKNVVSFEVTAKDKDGKDVAIDEQESAKKLVSPKWYTRERKIDNPEIDEDTPFEINEDTQFLFQEDRYTLMTDPENDTKMINPKDAGEYYLVYVYSGENGKYKMGHSDPIKVTIDPAALVLKPTKISLAEGMDKAAVDEALAKTEYKLWQGEKEYTKPVDFFGVSYGENNKTQYFNPVFELEMRQKKASEDIKEGASEDEQYSAWAKYTGGLLSTGTEARPIQYRVKFTGKKAIYNTKGNYTKLVDITDTTTNSAEKNYCVKADEDTLKNKDNTLIVELEKRTETKIDFNEIVKPFNNGTGEIDNPAWKIFDNSFLFDTDKEGRASYKKAIVTGDDIKPEDIQYKWQSGNLNYYERYIHTDNAINDGADKKQAKEQLEQSFKDDGEGAYIPYDAGIYRLHIEYKDSSDEPKNKPSSADVYFLIKQQELMIVADTQYAEYGDEIWEFNESSSRIGYSIYMLPDNKEEGFDPTKEEKLNWRIPYDEEEEYSFLQWNALNLDKNPDGTNKEDKPENYVRSSGEFINDKVNPYIYKARAILFDPSDYIYDTDGEYIGKWSNYTNKNKASWDSEKKIYQYHTQLGDIKFSANEIEISVDAQKMPQTRVYNGETIAESLPEGLIVLKDKTTGNPIADIPLNKDVEDVVGAVNVKWYWNEADKYVSTEEAVFGGTYELYVSFSGNDNYKAFEWQPVTDSNGKSYTFTIKPLEVTATPKSDEAVAGQPVATLMQGVKFESADEKYPIPESDQSLFEYTDSLRLDAIYGGIESYKGYGILQGTYIDEEYSYQCDFSSTIYRNNKLNTNSLIRYGKNYTVKLQENTPLFAQYAYSYRITCKPATPDKINRGESEIRSTGFLKNGDNDGFVDLYVERDNEGAYNIKPREGIPFAYKNYYAELNSDGKKIPMDKNYIAVEIVSPMEFSEELTNDQIAKQLFTYKNSIKNAGGYILSEQTVPEYSAELKKDIKRYLIKALFPVVRDEESGEIENPKRSFSIAWEEGYTDTFNLDLTNAVLESNLREAVAPKSLAFNGVQAKMAVGETQQLDVKITKVQLGDVVQINYRVVDGEGIAVIDAETGRLTALATKDNKPTAVTVEAYPVRLSADGKTFEEITGKGVKIAKTKITVTEVTAPAVKKVIVGDETATVQFTHVNDGYRREIYVVDATDDPAKKKWKPADFETEISKMQNGQWRGIFAIAPVYSYKSDYSTTLKLDIKQLKELDAQRSYVVYVRNVSAVRALADGHSKVTLSYAGSVKAFDTTKVQVTGLYPWFDMEAPKNTVTYYNDNQYSNPIKDAEYTVSLFDKSAQLSVCGEFPLKPSDTSAEDKDTLDVFTLPLKVAEKGAEIKLTDYYLEPKLSYYITDGAKPSLNDKKKQTNPSQYATISNSGKITLKGVGRNGEAVVTLWVIADNGKFGSTKLHITAQPDTMTPKKVKPLKVGDGIRLADYLEYKQGKNKVPNYWSNQITISDEDIKKAEDAGFELHQIDENDYQDGKGYTYPSIDGSLRPGEWIITAVKATTEKPLLTVQDGSVLQGEGETKTPASADLELSTAALDGVKSLKTAYVDDKHITINFGHTGHAEAFNIEVKDARGSVVYKKLAWREDAWNNIVRNIASTPWIQEEQRSIVGDLYGNDNFKYFEKTKTYAYTITTDKLVRLSAYTITVTPIYRGQEAAKPATTKTKTTNIPASYQNIMNPNKYDGIEIGIGWSGDTLSYVPYLTSGNTYTLSAGLENDEDNYLAKTRGTDTLTWKSSNTKVASVKANPGSFSATLKAVQQGTTIITVTSKITKKVIARYLIAVKAVGKGAPTYGGDYEESGNRFYDDIIATYDPLYEGRLEVLTLSNPVSVEYDDRYSEDDHFSDHTWVQFIAPTFGEYTFDINNGYTLYYGDKSEVGNSGLYRIKLEAGQKIYFCVRGQFTLKVKDYTDFTKLTIANTKNVPLKAESDSWITFTAPEDNYYTFESNVQIQRYMFNNVEDYNYGSKLEKGLKAGETVFIYVTKGSRLWVSYRDISKELEVKDGSGSVPVTFTKDNAKEAQYVKFTAMATGDYIFETPDDVDAVYLSETDNKEYPDGGAVISPKAEAMTMSARVGEDAAQTINQFRLFMESGETIVIKLTLKDTVAITAEKPEISVTVKVTSTAVKGLSAGAAPEKVTKNTSATFSWTVPEEKGTNKYVFNVTDGSSIWYNSKHETIYPYSISELIVHDDGSTSNSNIKPGDTIYIKVNTDTDKDASISITKVDGTKILTAGTPVNLILKNGYEDWYTFTVKKTGYYEFGTTVTENAADKGTHEVSAVSCNGVFGGYDGQYYIGNNTVSDIVMLKAEQTIVFKTEVTSWTSADDVTTTATFYVNEISAAPLKEGDTKVSLNKANSAVYYSFTGTANDTYTVQWTPDKDTGNAFVSYGTNLSGLGYWDTSDPVTISGTSTCYFKVTQNTETAVKGTLTVTKKKVLPLVADKSTSFTLKSGEATDYLFTIPANSELGYSVVVENTTAVKENESKPIISVTGNVSNDYGIRDVYYYGAESWTTVNNTNDATKKITITANGDVTGNIIVKPIVAQPLTGNVDDVKVTKAAPVWYRFEVKTAGRYVLEGAAKENNTASVKWYKKIGSGKDPVSSKDYFDQGDVLYVNVLTSEVKEQSASVKLPVVLPTQELKLGEDGITGTTEVKFAENQTEAYYVFKAPAFASYTFEGYDNIQKYIPDKTNSDYWSNGNMLEAEETLLIRVVTDGTLKVTKGVIHELKLDKPSDEVTLKIGESATFVFNSYVTSTYDFRTSTAKGLSVDRYNTIETENRLYFTESIDANDRLIFTITNNGDAEAKFTVTAGQIVPVELELDKTIDVTVAKDRVSVLSFKAPETGRYTVSCTGSDVTLIDNYKDNILFEYTPGEDEPYTYTLSYNGAENSQVAKVTITTLQTEDASGEEFTVPLEKGQVKWYAYKAAKTGQYTFTTEAATISMQKYFDLVSWSNMSDPIIIAEGSVLYIRVENFGNKQDAVIKVATDAMDELTLGSKTIDLEDVSVKPVAFKAPEDGFYIFTSNDSNLTYYADNLSGDNVSCNSSGNQQFFIMKDKTVFLKVNGYSGMAVVNVQEGDPIPETTTLRVGDSIETTVEQGESVWFTFTAPSDGEYSFYSSDNEGDPKVWLYSGQKTRNSYEYNGKNYYYNVLDDDGGQENNNFAITYELKAGQKIYLETSHYIHERAIKYTVNVMRGEYIPDYSDEE